MAFADYKIGLTKHAHEQYCARVETIDKEALRSLVTEQITSGEYHRKREFINLDGVWWVFEIREGVMIYVTCYGKTHIDIPSALAWAYRNKDRIDLTGGEVSCIGETE